MPSIRDRFWLWCHQAGSHDDQYGLPGPSAVRPGAALRQLGLANAIMVCYGGQPEPPFDATDFRGCDQLVWSIVGDSSSTRNDETADIDAVLDLQSRSANLVGGIMDDFFHPIEHRAQHGIARYSVDQVADFRRRLQAAPSPMDLWVVVYDQILDEQLGPHLAHCDVISYWTWKAENLHRLPESMDRLEAIAPHTRKLLGCYMWDYGADSPMPLDRMQYQCRLGLDWLRSGRIDGMIFLASNLCGLDIPALHWTRDWIASAAR